MIDFINYIRHFFRPKLCECVVRPGASFILTFEDETQFTGGWHVWWTYPDMDRCDASTECWLYCALRKHMRKQR